MTSVEIIKELDDKIQYKNTRHILSRKTAKISALSTG